MDFDHLHGQLLRIVAPLVMAPCGPQPEDAIRLAGIVRAGVNKTRIVLLAGAKTPAGVAIEFNLAEDGRTELNVDAAVDWVRTLTGADLMAAAGDRDSHGHVIVPAEALGFAANRPATRYDINYFSLLRQILCGGGVLWFEDTYTLNGYLLSGPDRHRLYIRNTRTGTVSGIDLPLTQADGSIRPGQGGSFPMELPTVVRTDHLLVQKRIPTPDDYCTVVYDMSEWIDPPRGPEPELF